MIEYNEHTEIPDLELIAALAEEIWTEHYTPILGAAQVIYMLDRFQSLSAMQAQIENESYRYFSISEDGKMFGYAGLRPDDAKTIYLSKLYIAKPYRGRGLARKLLNFAISKFQPPENAVIWLNVNKYNENSINSYKRLGFQVTAEMVADIGNGYVMDDYRMESEIHLIENR